MLNARWWLLPLTILFADLFTVLHSYRQPTIVSLVGDGFVLMSTTTTTSNRGGSTVRSHADLYSDDEEEGGGGDEDEGGGADECGFKTHNQRETDALNDDIDTTMAVHGGCFWVDSTWR